MGTCYFFLGGERILKLFLIVPKCWKRRGWWRLHRWIESWSCNQETRGRKWWRHGRHNRGQRNRRGLMQGRATRRGTELVQGERGALALTLTLALGLAVLFRVLLHFGVAISGGITWRTSTAWWKTRRYGARRWETKFHYVGEFTIWKKK